MKHTPGIWTNRDGAIICEHINDYGNFIIITLNRDRTSEDEANLKLMATAPELLKALKVALVEMEGYEEAEGVKLTESIKQAKDAIAKAEK